MTSQCPDHPGRLDARLGDCIYCRREAVPAERVHELAKAVRAEVKRPSRPTADDKPDPTRDRALARARDRADKDQP